MDFSWCDWSERSGDCGDLAAETIPEAKPERCTTHTYVAAYGKNDWKRIFNRVLMSNIAHAGPFSKVIKFIFRRKHTVCDNHRLSNEEGLVPFETEHGWVYVPYDTLFRAEGETIEIKEKSNDDQGGGEYG